jgi:hypothetical protein
MNTSRIRFSVGYIGREIGGESEIQQEMRRR